MMETFDTGSSGSGVPVKCIISVSYLKLEIHVCNV